MELPKPKVERCFFAPGFEPPLQAMELCWEPDDSCVAEHAWHLPVGVLLKSAAPQRFGISIHRFGKDSYKVRVLWNRLCLCWDELTRAQIMSSSLTILMNALGSDLWRLLNQSGEEADLVQAA
jgi:hypothetical protein